MSDKRRDDPLDAAEPRQSVPREVSQRVTRVSAGQLTSRSSGRIKALTELDSPELAFTGLESHPAANENGEAPAVPGAVEPDVKTHVHTHVAQDAWFDVRLNALGTPDSRQALALRFEAAFAAHTLLLPRAPNAEARDLLVNVLRRYEKALRSAAGSVDERTGQTTVALHGLLNDASIAAIEDMLSELEVTLLTVDECVTEEQFRKQFTRQHVEPKLLFQYARFLAARGFDIGYRRDRFEHLALELLTTKLPSGKLLLAPRKRAANVVLRLTRGLKRPEVLSALEVPLSYLRDSLDRLQNLTRAKQFFDSGFFVDVSGFKISKPDFITSPEFLYVCVAIEVEVHNCLQSWSELTKEPKSVELAALQGQLGEQLQLARAAYSAFQYPLGGRTTREVKKPKRVARSWSFSASSWLRLGGVGVLLALVVVANLYVLDVVRIQEPPQALSAERMTQLSPLLQEGQLTHGGKRFVGVVARPAWNRLPPRERRVAADALAQGLKAQGIDHAEVLAYKTRVIQIDFGSVVFLDDGQR